MSAARIFHSVQALLAVYSTALSSSAIRKLLGYESQTEKAAKFTNTAAKQLHKTRTTQTSGLLSILFSLGTSLYYVFSDAASSKWFNIAICAVQLALLSASHAHVSNFWRNKSKAPALPGTRDYNEAVDTSNHVRQLIGWLVVSWGLAGGLYFVGMF